MTTTNNKIDIILLRLKDTAAALFKKIGAVQHPMNLVYLASWLQEYGYVPEIVDLEVSSWSYLENKIRSVRPCLVGITAMTPDILNAKGVCMLCRSLGIDGIRRTASNSLTCSNDSRDKKTGLWIILGELYFCRNTILQ